MLTAGQITGVRFYKGLKNTGIHVGTLWTSTGTVRANATFQNESSTGWQTATFPHAVSVSPGQTYVIGYHTDRGHYAGDNNYFAGKGAGTQQVRALADGVQGGNGLYQYGSRAFPTSSWKDTNYYVDVTFTPNTGGGVTTTTSSTTTAAPTTTVKPTTTTQPPTTTTTRPPPRPPPNPPRAPAGRSPCPVP